MDGFFGMLTYGQVSCSAVPWAVPGLSARVLPKSGLTEAEENATNFSMLSGTMVLVKLRLLFAIVISLLDPKNCISQNWEEQLTLTDPNAKGPVGQPVWDIWLGPQNKPLALASS